ncbi:LacI family DNA-binding transcriptional regulator [Streptosporangium sp. NPDC023825]|uniref:LacI family DNA-binding transcriptional regulator n=1 Tax=Streptosporangium sp. NPDC023825 TaxID=3154909 RepID=UPI00341A017B
MLAGMTRRLAEVAKRVGVSEATVSRVLNGRRGVSESTRDAVLAALAALGYERPTRLHRDRARLIGLVFPDLHNPIFPAFAEVVGGALAQQGFTSVLCTRTSGGLQEADYVDLMLAQHVSGVVFAGGAYAEGDASHEHYARILERRLPAVLVNASAGHLGFSQVSCDDVAAAEMAAGHLRALGHERVGMLLGPADHMPSRRKLETFAAYARAHGMDFGERFVEHAVFSMEGGQAAAARLVRRGVTGLICGSDLLALGAVRAARREGLAVPRDVSVIGYDDSAMMNRTDPPLTTVRQPIEAMGRAAVDLLVAQIDAAALPGGELLFDPELVVRASTAPAVPRAVPA